MNTKYFIVGIAAALITVSCTKPSKSPGTSVHLRTVVDVTDPLTVIPDSTALLEVLGLEDDRNISARVGITVITDKVLNPVTEFVLPDKATSDKNNISDDVHYRDKEILAFYSNITRALRQIKIPKDSTEALTRSEVLTTLGKELQKLKEDHKSSRKILYVFSDLMENGVFDAYHTPMATENEKESVKQMISKMKLLPDSLTGIRVYFFYNPHDREADTRFGNISAVISEILREHGATVFIQASNKTMEYE